MVPGIFEWWPGIFSPSELECVKMRRRRNQGVVSGEGLGPPYGRQDGFWFGGASGALSSGPGAEPQPQMRFDDFYPEFMQF